MVLGSEKNEIKENYQISVFFHYWILKTIWQSKTMLGYMFQPFTDSFWACVQGVVFSSINTSVWFYDLWVLHISVHTWKKPKDWWVNIHISEKAMLHYAVAINTIMWERLGFFAMCPLIMGCFRCGTHSTAGKTSRPQLGRWLISPARYHRPVPRARIQSEPVGLPHHLWAVRLRMLKLLHNKVPLQGVS